MIAALDDLTHRPPRLPLFESSREPPFVSDRQRQAYFGRWHSSLPTLAQMAEHFDRYDDILAAFGRQISQGYAITPFDTRLDHSLDSQPPAWAPGTSIIADERRQAARRRWALEQKAAKLQAKYEAEQREKQQRREKTAEQQWNAAKARRVEEAEAQRLARGQRMTETQRVTIEMPFTDPNMVAWFFALAAHSGAENAKKWVMEYLEKSGQARP